MSNENYGPNADPEKPTKFEGVNLITVGELISELHRYPHHYVVELATCCGHPQLSVGSHEAKLDGMLDREHGTVQMIWDMEP